MSEWMLTTVGAHVEINSKSITKEWGHHECLYLDTGSITKGRIENLQKLKRSNLPSRAKRLVQHLDIVYSLVRPNQEHYGLIISPPDNLVVSTGFAVITPNQSIVYSSYLYYWLIQSELIELLHSIAEGSTSAYPSLIPNDINLLEILLPPLPEQKAIASVLSSLDDKIDLLHRQNKTLESMAETLFRQWFIEEAEDDWDELPLKNFVTVIDNRGKTPPYFNSLTKHAVIEVNAITQPSRSVNYAVIKKYVNEETFNTWFRSHLKPFDVLVSTVGSIGSFAMFFGGTACIAQNVIGLRAKKELSNYYLYQWLLANTAVVKELNIGSVQPSIKVPHLLSLPIKIPNKDRLQKFDEQVHYLVNKIKINCNSITNLEKLRDTLLPKLINGEVRVKYDTDAVA